MIKINMGCGWRNFGRDWIHIDGGNYNHLDYESITDLSQFDDETVELIYASHVIEYFDCEEVKQILQEWNRVLVPKGILRIAVPNFNAIARLYCDGVDLGRLVGPLYGRMQMGNNWIYHKTVYDLKSITDLLETCNFSETRLYDWKETDHAHFDDHSQAYYPHMNKTSGTLISLNVECNKC